MDLDKNSITKLNGTNYLVWATKFEAFSQALGLKKHIEGSALGDAASAEAKDQDAKQNRTSDCC